jgi:hypothetical protein
MSFTLDPQVAEALAPIAAATAGTPVEGCAGAPAQVPAGRRACLAGSGYSRPAARRPVTRTHSSRR